MEWFSGRRAGAGGSGLGWLLHRRENRCRGARERGWEPFGDPTRAGTASRSGGDPASRKCYVRDGRSAVVAEITAQSVPAIATVAAIREGDWKLVAHWDATGPFTGVTPEAIRALKRAKLIDFELYHLREDIAEKHDLAAAQPQRVQAMAGRIRQIFAEQWIGKAHPGWMVQKADGSWIKKASA